jgi:hypothetical protein
VLVSLDASVLPKNPKAVSPYLRDRFTRVPESGARLASKLIAAKRERNAVVL